MGWRSRVEISGDFCILWAFLIMVLPPRLLLASAVSAMLHEAFHAVAVWFTGGSVRGVRLEAGGIVMDVAEMDGVRELFCASAGPVGSLLLACAPYPLLSLCGLVQGLFNLIPVMPLDGGRMMGCILDLTVPHFRTQIERGVALMVWAALLVIACYLGGGAVLLWLVVVFRKFPCKPWGKRVQ